LQVNSMRELFILIGLRFLLNSFQFPLLWLINVIHEFLGFVRVHWNQKNLDITGEIRRMLSWTSRISPLAPGYRLVVWPSKNFHEVLCPSSFNMYLLLSLSQKRKGPESQPSVTRTPFFTSLDSTTSMLRLLPSVDNLSQQGPEEQSLHWRKRRRSWDCSSHLQGAI
jgi:hypothetical protein